MSEANSFSYGIFVGLEIVCDNARSHAPFPKTVEAASRETELEMTQPISPERGLTRWGSQEDLLSKTPRQPVRGPPSDMTTPSWPSPQQWNHRETRIDRIRSRWNSQLCRDDETIGKISLSPTMPQRCLEDLRIPVTEDSDVEKKDLSFFEKTEKTEGIFWKRIINKRPLRRSKTPSCSIAKESPLNEIPE